MDNSPEFLNALRYAAIRASKTGGAVEILGIIGPEEFQHWLGVGEAMRAEARERIEAHFAIFSKWMVEKEGFEPEYGARPVKRVIQKLVLNKLSKEILAGKVNANSSILLDSFNNELVFRNQTELAK